jgi:NACHT domain
VDQYRELFDYLGSHLPKPLQWLIPLLAIVLILGSVSWLRASIAAAFHALARPFSAIRRRESEQHRAFVDSLSARLNQINANADWTDRHYAELEAQVESSVAGTPRRLPRILFRDDGGLRRQNLVQALRNHPSQFILLQGSPGSGKSVALRHLALTKCQNARHGRPWRRPVPLYVNLRDFKPEPGPISADTISEYIFRTLSSLDHSRQTRYAKDNFDAAVAKGGWLFLFDGFDEIPDVLAAVQVDATIRRYADAISSFCADVGACRSVIASRDYRGPERLDWPRLEIVGLNDERQRDFVRRARLGPVRERVVLRGLPLASSSVQQLIDNPMFLGLVVNYVEREGSFPVTSHEVFESYAAQALRESEGSSRFGIDTRAVREISEEVAYCMSADSNLGLSATVSEIADARHRLGMAPRSMEELGSAVASLTAVRLTRTDETFPTFDSTPISFSHRRFQEYFATRYVLAKPGLVSAEALLTNGRWRETAVTIVQTQNEQVVNHLLDKATGLLEPFSKEMDELPTNDDGDQRFELARFAWPPNVLHVLSILEDGIGGPSVPQHSVIKTIERILLNAAKYGIVLDKRWALEVSGPVGPEARIELLRMCLRSGSEWLREGAFRHMRRLAALPKDISRELAFSLITFSVGGRLRRDRPSIRAQIANLREPQRFVTYLWMLSYLPLVDLAAHIPVLIPYIMTGGEPNKLINSLDGESTVASTPFPGLTNLLDAMAREINHLLSTIPPMMGIIFLVCASNLLIYLLRGTTSFSWSVATSRARGAFELMRRVPFLDGLTVGYLMIGLRVTLAIGSPLITGSSVASTPWFLLELYCLTWAPACLVAIRDDRYAGLLVAVLIPQLLMLIRILRTILTLVQSLTWKKLSSLLLGIIGLAALWFALQEFKFLVTILAYFLGALFGLVFLGMVAGAGVSAMWWVRDALRFTRDSQRPHSLRSAEEFIDLLMAYRSPYFVVRYMRILRGVGDPSLSEGVAESMRDVAWAIDQVVRLSPVTSLFPRFAPGLLGPGSSHLLATEVLKGVRSEPVREWLQSLGDKSPQRLRRFGATMEDELGRALARMARISLS